MARTKFSSWQVPFVEMSQMKYVEVNHSTPAHIAQRTIVYTIPFPNDIQGINMKTIRVESEEDIVFMVRLRDESENAPIIYESLKEQKICYDQVDLPYRPSNKNLYVEIINLDYKTTKFHITIKGMEVM